MDRIDIPRSHEFVRIGTAAVYNGQEYCLLYNGLGFPLDLETTRALAKELLRSADEIPQDVLDRACSRVWEDLEEEMRGTPEKIKDPKPGWIYVLDYGVGLYKIGRTTKSPEYRLKAYQQMLPQFDLRIRARWQVKDTETDEASIHKELEQYRHFSGRGEWFKIPDDVAAKLFDGRAHGE